MTGERHEVLAEHFLGDAGGIDRNHTAGLGRRSTHDDKKRVMKRYAENIIRKID